MEEEENDISEVPTLEVVHRRMQDYHLRRLNYGVVVITIAKFLSKTYELSFKAVFKS